MYIYTCERILFAVEGAWGVGLSFCPWALVGPFPWALFGPFPTEQSEACSERSDEVRGCKLHITQTTSSA